MKRGELPKPSFTLSHPDAAALSAVFRAFFDTSSKNVTDVDGTGMQTLQGGGGALLWTRSFEQKDD